jgi:tetratricopeptide (TPR) repeat protein
MAKEKKSQGVMEELEGEVNEDLHPLLKKVEEHIKTIGLVVGLIILSAAAYSGYDYYQEKSFEQAKTKLGDILAEKQGPSKISALEKFLGQAPDSMLQGVQLELAKLCMQEGKYEQASTYWQALASSGPENLHTVALLGQAKAERMQGNFQKAQQILKDLAQQAPKAYTRNIQLELAATAEEAQDWKQALKAYQTVKSEMDNVQGGGKKDYFDYKITQIRKKMDSGNS